ncbi:MAG: cell surface protein SprA, partial [Rhodothermia bacterium]
LPDSVEVIHALADSVEVIGAGADSVEVIGAGADSVEVIDALAEDSTGIRIEPDSLLAAVTDTVRADSAMVDSSIVDRYIPKFRSDGYSASPFPRRKDNLSLRLGSYWRHEIKMDSTGRRYISREMVAGSDVRYPLILDPEQYRDARYLRDKDDTFRELVQQRSRRRRGGRRGFGLSVVVPGGESSAFSTIFGKPEVDLRVNGQVNINAGMTYQKSDQRISLTGNTGQLDPDFGQNIRLGITGSIGDKLRIDVNWDTERTFDFQNQLKLEYTGYEDDIIKRIAAGNVFLQTPSSLIQGSQRLFGIRTDFQIGGLRLATVMSQQEARSEELAIEGGSQTTKFDLRPTNYDDATHFFQAFYFRNRWEESMGKPPILQLQIDRITDIEVWKLKQTTVEQDNERQVIALVDLAEPSSFADDPLNPAEVQPDPEVDRYSAEDLAFIRDGTKAIEGYLTGLGVKSKDFQVGKFKRLDRRRDYEIDEFLGTLTLNNRLTENESVAIAMRYVNRNGRVIQVGDFSNDDGGSTGQQNDNRIVLKLLRKANQISSDPAWPLTMRNVYKIQGRGFTRDVFELDVFYERAGQPATRTLPGLTTQGGQLSLLQITGLDRLNEDEAPIPDNKFDFQPYIIDAGEGLLFFPVLEPFAGTIARFTEDETLIFRKLYTQKQAEARRDSQHDVYRIRGSFSSTVQEVYNLGFFGIVEGSVLVKSGGSNLTEGADYVVDYTTNTVTITNRSFLAAGRDIQITYERNQFAAIQKKSLLGLRADYDISQDVKLGATWMKLSEKPLIDKFRIGEEPLSNSIWGIDGAAAFAPRWLTRAIDAIPLIQTRAPSSVTFSGEFAQLLPGHPSTQAFDRTRSDLRSRNLDFKEDEVRGISYIDDFEGVETGITLAQPGAWRLSAPPDSTGAVGPDVVLGNVERSKWRSTMGWYVLPINAADFFDFSQNAQNFDAVRQIHVKEVFPERDVSAQTGAGLILPTFDLYFDPSLPGP